jgi:hypothetical protein
MSFSSVTFAVPSVFAVPADGSRVSDQHRPAPEAAPEPLNRLTPQEEAVVQQLKARDAEVRRHEQSHLMAGRPHAHGPAHYTYQLGPDGKRYAIGGDVRIDLRPVPGNPKATLQKAQIIRRSALAPEEPSAQDRRIAQQADRMIAQARQELRAQQQAAPASSSAAPEPLSRTGQHVDQYA